MKEEIKHGWYSSQCFSKIGYVIWLTPEGKQVIVTMVTDSATDSGTSWKDAQYVGPVTRFVSSYKVKSDWNKTILDFK